MKRYDWVNKIKAVGFDVDGTLYHTSDGMWDWFKKRLIKRVCEHLGESEENVAKIYEKRVSKYRSNTLTLNSFGLDGEEVFQDLFDSKEAIEFMKKSVKKDKRLIKLVAELKRRYEVFIISNGTEHQIVRKMKMIGLEKEDFDPFIACYDHDGWVKPNPDSFLYVLESLGLSPEEALFVGDRVRTDIEGAKKVGMRTAMVWGESEQADISLKSVYQLKEFLNV